MPIDEKNDKTLLWLLQLLKTLAGSPASSISLDDVQSDLGDPLHDKDILEDLFYKQVID